MTIAEYHEAEGEARLQTGHIPASEGVSTDPATKAKLRLLDAQPLQNVIDMLADVKTKIAAMREDESLLEAYVESRMIADNAAIANHPDFEKIALESKKDVDVDVYTLYTELDLLVSEGVISEEARNKAVWTERIPAQTVFKSHLSRIRDLLKYGDKVRAVYEQCVRETEGPPRLKMIPKKQK